MNRYLDEATAKSIKEQMIRFDDRSIPGKTVARAMYGTVTGIAFTDGTWAAVEAEAEYDGSASNHEPYELDMYDLRDLGLITEEQFKAASNKEREAKAAAKLEQIKRLQSEIDCGY